MGRRIAWIAGLALAAGVLGGGYAVATRDSVGDADRSAWRTAVVDRGDIVNAVSATGTLSPVNTVEVGSQISGQIAELFADYNSVVTRGQLIARIDPATYASRVAQAGADLEIARAGVLAQEAAVMRARADADNARNAVAGAVAAGARTDAMLQDAEREYERRRALLERGIASTRDREKAETELKSQRAARQGQAAAERAAQAQALAAQAMIRAAEAQLETARAQVRQREAQLRAAEIDLARTEIRAPVDGVVLSRQVNVGQTVSVQLQTPVLFTLAQDLRDMQVEVAVDEADIGRVAPGQQAVFTVDAFPGRDFGGTVAQVRKQPRSTQNVVTYTVIVATRNDDQRLLPGLTATIRIIAARRDGVLRLPDAALRYRPPGVAAASDGRQHVYVLEQDGQARPRGVTLGLGDGSFTELADGLALGDQVVIGGGQRRQAAGSGLRLGF